MEMGDVMNEFRILSDEDHILLRPSMFVSSVVETDLTGYFYLGDKSENKTISIVPALNKIISEVLDNSIDEYIRTHGKFSNKIDVTMVKLDNTLQIKITDNGRGLSNEISKEHNQYKSVLSFTRARSGTSFTTDSVSIGSNGYGIFLTYCFSSEFSVETHDGKTGLIFNKPDSVKAFASKKQGTTVTFTPNMKHFDIVFNNHSFNSHCELIKQRMFNLSLCYPKIKFTFNGEPISVKSIDVFANSISGNNVVYKSDNFSIIIASTAECQEFRHHTFVNGLWV